MSLTDLPGLSPASRRRLRRRGLRSARDLRALAKREGWDALPVPAITRAFLRWRPRKSLTRPNAARAGKVLARAVRVAFGAGTPRRPHKVDVVGGVRRGKARSKDVDLLLSVPGLDSRASTPRVELAGRSARLLEVYAAGPRRVSAVVEVSLPRPRTRAAKGRGRRAPPRQPKKLRFRSDFFLAAPASRPYALLHHTGPWEYNVRLRAHAKRRGLLLNQYGIWRGRRRAGPVARTERGVVRSLGATYYPPAKRR
jgi:DNA polymerase/3'-5' exonuclease PolX